MLELVLERPDNKNCLEMRILGPAVVNYFFWATNWQNKIGQP